MKYIGIDLGTTNSVICSFDGEETRLHTSPRHPEGITPSVIYIDSRGRRFYGTDAYDQAAFDPDRAAAGFKRLMGSTTPIRLPAANVILTPEECSAEILQLLFGYLPADFRSSGDTGVVVTVPAAFNQVQKEATLLAAERAALGRVTLIQEPVAAVMSVMRKRKTDGIFVVYDLGGGTLDIAVAQSTSGKVDILSGGGITMCGGRDFDRALIDNVVTPWLQDNFDLPDELGSEPEYRNLLRRATFAAEKAKIALSKGKVALIALSNAELEVRDESGNAVFLEIALDREQLDELISSRVEESIEKVRETLNKAHLSPDDVERIVFIGGPTSYKPLRDRVSQELGISPSTDLDPMTAVAEGAAIFAESVDWSSSSRGRKSSRASVNAAVDIGLTFDYFERTSDLKARLAVKLARPLDGFEIQVDSTNTGLTSGRLSLVDRAMIELALAKPGENAFKIFVFDSDGRPVPLAKDRIVISRTPATVDPIASYSIGLEVRERPGGAVVLHELLREGDRLPKKGQVEVRTEHSLSTGSSESIRFRLQEGPGPLRAGTTALMGMFEIHGSDFLEGTIPAGGTLLCNYEISAACVKLVVDVPDVHCSFPSKNFYSPRDAMIDFSQASALISDLSNHVQHRLKEIEVRIDDPRLAQAHAMLQEARSLRSENLDGHDAKQAMERLQQANELIAKTREDHREEFRQMDLDRTTEYFNTSARQYARPAEITAFERLVETARRAIRNPSRDFDAHIGELRQRSAEILWRQDWYVIDFFKQLSKDGFLFSNVSEHTRLVAVGTEALAANNIDKLRSVVNQLYSLRYESAGEVEIAATANIVRHSA